MERKAIVKFYYVRGEKNEFSSFIFFNERTEIEGNFSKEFYIPIENFKATNNILASEIILKNNQKNREIKYIINIYICENIFYLFLSDGGLTFELLFLDFGNIKINNNEYKFDNNYNIHRKRISLINYNLNYIYINDIFFIPYLHLPAIDDDKSNSFQFSFYSAKQII